SHVHLPFIEPRYVAMRSFSTAVGCTVARKMAPLLNPFILSSLSSALAEPVMTMRGANDSRKGSSPITVASDTVDPEKLGPRTRSIPGAVFVHAFQARRNHRLFRSAT